MENKETPVFSCSLCDADINVVSGKVDDEKLSYCNQQKLCGSRRGWPTGHGL